MCLEARDARDNSRITIFGKNGESLCLSVDGDSTCTVGLLHSDGKTGASITVSREGESRLILSDANGVPVIFSQSDLSQASEKP